MKNDGWRDFLTLCLSAKDEAVLAELFELLFTAEEIASLETRCSIIKALLEQKIPQRQMSEELHVSIAKITRGSNELKRISPALKKHLQHFFNLS